jgi:hypothetical protein
MYESVSPHHTTSCIRTSTDTGVARSRSAESPGKSSPPARDLGIKRQFIDIGSPEQGREVPAKQRNAGQDQDTKPKKKPKKKAKKNPAQQDAEQFERWQNIRDRFSDQREAAAIMWSKSTDGKPKGVTLCGWTMQAQHDDVKLVRQVAPDKAPRAFYRGLQKCGLGWVCPVCTTVKAQETREKLNALLSRGRADGWHMLMMTLTVRHDAKMPFGWLWQRLSAASDELRRTYAWKQVNKHLVGSAKAVEATHGAAGWHPHYHVILVFKASLTEAEATALAESLRGEWIRQIEAQGLTGNEHAFQVQGAAEAGNYIAKWGAAEEMSLGHAKQGRSGSRTPWQLLRESRDGDWMAGELWYEFVSAIKGTHQVRLTPGLRELIKEEIARKEADLEAKYASGELTRPEEPKEVDMGTLPREEWEDRARHRRVMMREAAEARTRREAEKKVWEARHGRHTDADLMLLDVIEPEDDLPSAQPVPEHDRPEEMLRKYKRQRLDDEIRQAKDRVAADRGGG